MYQLNIEFLEQYKALDNICKDIYGGPNGITQYIDTMSEKWTMGCYKVNGWQNDFDTLKQLRHKRNALAHESGTLQSDICDQIDIEWVKKFKNRIMQGDDPLALLRKSLQAPKRNPAARAYPYANSNSAYRKSVSTKPKEPDEAFGEDYSGFIMIGVALLFIVFVIIIGAIIL